MLDKETFIHIKEKALERHLRYRFINRRSRKTVQNDRSVEIIRSGKRSKWKREQLFPSRDVFGTSMNLVRRSSQRLQTNRMEHLLFLKERMRKFSSVERTRLLTLRHLTSLVVNKINYIRKNAWPQRFSCQTSKRLGESRGNVCTEDHPKLETNNLFFRWIPREKNHLPLFRQQIKVRLLWGWRRHCLWQHGKLAPSSHLNKSSKRQASAALILFRYSRWIKDKWKNWKRAVLF